MRFATKSPVLFTVYEDMTIYEIFIRGRVMDHFNVHSFNNFEGQVGITDLRCIPRDIAADGEH